MIIDRERKSNTSISKLICDNKCYTDKQNICDKLNEHFINVGPDLAVRLLTLQSDPALCIKHTFTNSFMFRGICKQEVIDLIKDVNVNKSSIGVPAKCIKPASSNISKPWLLFLICPC